ncbi:hypothetical protein [Aurantibacillus circumpalustris]|uniref:hypothetical protein n=1 Tax=Aurantibacillus circumpalustris TaxID=3036359 RepID=UPI00295B582C|nr:hypothetical protein [Aurantibacillus circumpalustris]
MRQILLVLIFISPLITFSQTRDKRSAPYTVRYNIGIQKSLSSQKFRTAFNGIFETNLSLNARVFSTFFIGVGYQYSHFQNNKAVFAFYQAKDPKGNATGATLSYNTRLIGNTPFIKIGYDHFFEKGFATFGLNAGYSLMHYNNVVNDSADANLPFPASKFNAGLLQPEISVSFITDRSLTFSIMVAYTTAFYKFDPKEPRFNAIDELRDKSNNYFMSWINIGFGVTLLLGKR